MVLCFAMCGQSVAQKSFNLSLFLDILTLPGHCDEKIETVTVWRREAA